MHVGLAGDWGIGAVLILFLAWTAGNLPAEWAFQALRDL